MSPDAFIPPSWQQVTLEDVALVVQGTWDEKKNPEGRWRAYSYDEITGRDKASLDIFWLRDESLEDSANLPEPRVIAEEIAEDLGAALEQIQGILEDLGEREIRPTREPAKWPPRPWRAPRSRG